MRSSSGISYIETPTITITPHALYQFYEYDLFSSRYQDCELKEYLDQTNTVSTVKFSKENSPLRFSNYITYQVGSKAKSIIQNDFYIAEISNYLEHEHKKWETKYKCGQVIGQQEVLTLPINNFSNSFYIRFYK